MLLANQATQSQRMEQLFAEKSGKKLKYLLFYKKIR